MDKLKKQKLKALLITAGGILMFGMFALAAFLVSINYNDLYGFPDPPKNGVMDMKGVSITNTYPKAIIGAGEWEFFYNRWIVTDNEAEAEPDCILKLPACWTGKKTVSGETMKRGAFGSYRLTVTGMEAGAEIAIGFSYPAACRIFINGVQSSQNGELSKNKNGGFVIKPEADKRDIVPYIAGEDEALEIVIEVSYNTYGGITVSPWIWGDLKGSFPPNLGRRMIEFSSYFIPGIIFAFVIFSFAMSLGNKKKLRNLSLPVFILLAFIQLLTVPETWHWMAPYFPFISYTFVFNLCLTLFHILPAAYFAHLVLNKTITLKKHETAVFGAVSAVLFILFYALWGTPYQFITLTLLAVSYMFVFYKLALASLKKTQYALFHLLMLIPLLTTTLLVPFDVFGVIVYPLRPGFSWMLFLIAAVFTALSYKIVRDNSKKALKSTELEKEIGRIKHQALQSQIKPHFIFNALSSIQALYERDKNEGSRALSKFASHLRQNIDSDSHDLIPFAQEVKNIMNYAELENLRLDKKLTLLIDIEYTGFEIPTLSLQPLVENAIRYAGTQDKEDGEICLHSRREGDTVIVEVTDNGAGFDPGKIRGNAAGLKNCRERLKYLLGADMHIKSVIGGGTAVVIRIPVKGNDEFPKEGKPE